MAKPETSSSGRFNGKSRTAQMPFARIHARGRISSASTMPPSLRYWSTAQSLTWLSNTKCLLLGFGAESLTPVGARHILTTYRSNQIAR